MQANVFRALACQKRETNRAPGAAAEDGYGKVEWLENFDFLIDGRGPRCSSTLTLELWHKAVLAMLHGLCAMMYTVQASGKPEAKLGAHDVVLEGCTVAACQIA